MNSKLFFSILVFPCLGAVSHANAAGSPVQFHGEVVGTTCNIDVNGAGPNAIIALPSVSTVDLASVDATAGRTYFSISLNDCSSYVGRASSSFFESGLSIDVATGRLINTDTTGAKNVQLQLLDVERDYAVIKAGDTDQLVDNYSVDISNGEAIMNYAVEYISQGNSSAGGVSSAVTYAIDYN